MFSTTFFIYAYWKALKEADMFQNKNGKHRKYSELEKRLKKKLTNSFYF